MYIRCFGPVVQQEDRVERNMQKLKTLSWYWQNETMIFEAEGCSNGESQRRIHLQKLGGFRLEVMLREHLEHLIKFSPIFVLTRCSNTEKIYQDFLMRLETPPCYKMCLICRILIQNFLMRIKTAPFSQKAVELEVVEGYEDMPAHTFTLFFCSSYFRDRRGIIKAR